MDLKQIKYIRGKGWKVWNQGKLVSLQDINIGCHGAQLWLYGRLIAVSTTSKCCSCWLSISQMRKSLHSECSIRFTKRSVNCQMSPMCEEALQLCAKLKWQLPLLHWRRHLTSSSDKQPQPAHSASHSSVVGTWQPYSGDKLGVTPFLTK